MAVGGVALPLGQACARSRPGGVGEQETVEGRGPILRMGGE